MTYSAKIESTITAHKAFWRGEGSSLLLIPTPLPDDLPAYRDCFAEPRLMWEAEVAKARKVVAWPTDAIPTIRPSLGVVFIPSMAGQEYQLPGDQMPWPGTPLSEEAIRKIPGIDVEEADLMQRALDFYAIHRESGVNDCVAYHADTQGVFDIAHMLWGDQIFYDAIDPSRESWMRELLGICCDLYVRVTQRLREALDQPEGTLIHGHGTPQGIYFPHTGCRTAEDTATLFSPETIRDIIMPFVEESVTPTGGAFAHFCGKHESLFEQLCASPNICAIDLQPGMHDLRWLLERCAASDTVLFSAVEELPGEDWKSYLRRIADHLQETGARAILRPAVYPENREECAEMLGLWHEWTA